MVQRQAFLSKLIPWPEGTASLLYSLQILSWVKGPVEESSVVAQGPQRKALGAVGLAWTMVGPLGTVEHCVRGLWELGHY